MSKAHLGKKLRPKTEVEKELARQQRILNIYEAIDPNGKIIIFNSLHLFSKENNLNRCSIQYAIKNKSYHKGWKFKVIGVI
jgi:hypothetical protein